ncbi:unnamed protein product [Oncorhynchus mykiss]|uniref:Uncharacterized protein n=1 Tax=Oncorhynchus mykiss TaxID=8022 RepID=A0A060ZAA4_ONCMY|nr:unnamed protein product [Oncorhynchus mykiss]
MSKKFCRAFLLASRCCFVSTQRQRAQDLEDELEKTNQAYKIQITSQEKKAHNNWLAARAADRDLADIKRENAHLRQKLTDTQFKLDLVEKDPYALDNMGRPPFRGERSPYGPSPLGHPASENRTFPSPPTLMDGPPHLSPNFPPMAPGGRGDFSSPNPLFSATCGTAPQPNVHGLRRVSLKHCRVSCSNRWHVMSL